MTRKPLFWILFVIVSVAALAFAVPNFSKSFPLISLDLRMDRPAALAAARDLALRYDLGPVGPRREAAAFVADDNATTFVDLEGGGADSLRAMLRNHVYEAYTWKVRLFREGETREATLRFRPDGRPYGFLDRLREDAPGASLSVDSARVIAETTAARDWGLDLSGYEPIPPSTEHRPGGRADHTFVYQRKDVKVGEGVYCIRLVVSGDRLTELAHFLRVPEAFSRTYEKMRTSNDALGFAAAALMIVLYVIGGCVVGLFLLMRKRWVWWTPALAWGFAISALQALAFLNNWPLAWMNYDTAVSGRTFLLQQVMGALLMFVADGCFVALTFAAAEGLGRRAFPDHPQLWKLWSRDGAASRPVVGGTLGGTLLTGIEFGYIIAFYLVTTRLWKWWAPAGPLVDPNVLASYLPWLSAVAPSLHAGFWEEALFRAVPLAGAALIGDRLGNRKLWIGIGLVTEALIFGGAHAGYPSWPAYSRPIELIVPSLIWGVVYLRYGLLPSVVTHYLFDLALFSLPLFTSTAAGSRIDQIAVIVCGAVPLAVVAWGVLRQRGITELPRSLRNGVWTARPEEAEPKVRVTEALVSAWSPRRTQIVMALGLAGLAAWAALGQWKLDAPPIRQDRGEALRIGLNALVARGFEPDPKWKRLVTTDADGIQSVFTWRSLGADTYRALIGKDLVPPHWEVRLANFRSQFAPAARNPAAPRGGKTISSGGNDVAERAEEWQARVTGDGQVWRARHVLPEGRRGATLDEAAARALAQAELRQRFALEPLSLVEKSAVSTRHPARLDWTFTFADPAPPALSKGSERRITVEIAGDRVSDAYRFVFVREEWQRTYRSTEATLNVLGMVRGLVAAGVLIAAAALGLVAWSRRAFPVRFSRSFFMMFVGFGVFGMINRWPSAEARFSTAQPLEFQTGMFVVSMALGLLVVGAVFALVAGWAVSELPDVPGRSRVPLTVSLAVGALAAGLLTTMGRLSVASGPLLGDYSSPQALLPWSAPGVSAATSLLTRAATLLALFMLARRISSGGTRRRPLAIAVLFVVGGIAAMTGSPASPGAWFAIAAITGLGIVGLEALALGYDPRVIPGLLASMGALGALRGIARHGFPDATLAGALELVAIAFVTWWWVRQLNATGTRDATATPTAAEPIEAAPRILT
jgi:hypothetical protein